MTYSDIEFRQDRGLRISREANLKFNPLEPRALVVQVRALRHRRVQREGTETFIVDADSRHVGRCWFDAESQARLDDCVVLVVADGSEVLDSERICHVLLVSKRTLGGQYERTGLAEISARFVSRKPQTRSLF